MRKRDPYHYKECGLDDIYLANGFTYVKTPRGGGIKIEDIEGLHLAIGRTLVRERKSWTGKELRFLRHELGLTQQALGHMLDVDSQTVARWEKKNGGNAEGIPGPAQRLVGLIYEEHTHGNRSVSELLERLADLDKDTGVDEDITFEKSKEEGWQPAIAA